MEEEGQEKPPALTEKQIRMLRQIGDHNLVGGYDHKHIIQVSAVTKKQIPRVPPNPPPAVSPSPERKEDNSSPSSGNRSSTRPKVPVKRLLDPSDGSEVDNTMKKKSRGTSETAPTRPNVVKIGDEICQKWALDEARTIIDWYVGKVADGPIERDGEIVYKIFYKDDGDTEFLEKEEVLKLIEFERARKELCYKVGNSHYDVCSALDKMGKPYIGRQNEAQKLILDARIGPHRQEEEQQPLTKFIPEIGLEIRKNFNGKAYKGKVISGPEITLDDNDEEEKTWKVHFEDGDQEDMTWSQLFVWRANRPSKRHGSIGRELVSLELFSGQSIISQKFAEERFQIVSIDNNPHSNANIIVDIMKLRFEHIGTLPDFIWVSPPCFTYSRLAGTKHRNPKEGDFEKSDEAKLNNKILLQVFCIIRWVRSLHPHLIVVIENPDAMLKDMPLMEDFCDKNNFGRTKVDYCAFGEDHKKPTNLWSNDRVLLDRLSKYRCTPGRCPYSRKGFSHPTGARGNKSNYDTAVIPEGLAECVAEYVKAKFVMDQVRASKQHQVTEMDKEVLHRMLDSEKPL